MRRFYLIPFLVLITGNITAQHAHKSHLPAPVIADELLPAMNATLLGYTGEKLSLSLQNRILAQDVNKLVEPFTIRNETSCWQSEFWGKWITSAILAYRYNPQPALKTKIDHAVSALIATQTPDGYIGNYAPDSHLESWDIWGRKYCLLGLLAYYDLTHDKATLQAACKLIDHLITELKSRNELIVKKGNHRGMAASSVLEPVCLLYARTGNKQYLDFAEEIVHQWETPDGPKLISKSDIEVYQRFPKARNWFGWEQGQKAYEMMSCYEGLLELYRLTARTEYLSAVEKTWQSIMENEINIAGSGSSVECWFGGKQLQTIPVYHYQETCVTVTWIKLNQQLLRLTGNAKYAEAIEQAYYNALLGSMKPDGSDWAKYSPLSGQRMDGSEQCNMGLNCCVASGPRGLFTLPGTVVMKTHAGIQVNFFTGGTFELTSPGQQTITVFQETDYPADGKVKIRLLLPKTEEMGLNIRIPSWSQQTTVTINNEPVENVIPGEYLSIHRKWKSDDRVELELDMRGRVIIMGKQPENVAIVRGPVVLARDARLAGPVVGAIIRPVVDKNGYIQLSPVEKKREDIWMQFKVNCLPEAYTEQGPTPLQTEFCDYASAGNTYDEKSFFRVWLPQLYNPSK